MPIARTRSVLSGMQVKEAMRRQMISLDGKASIAAGIGRLIKYKADALLVVDSNDGPAGIVTKTDMAGAYYAGLPVDTPLEAIMVGPLHTCFVDDQLDRALDTMRNSGIHQLYVVGADARRFEGMLNYGDILGMVFHICRSCRKGRLQQSAVGQPGRGPSESTVSDVMTPAVITCRTADDLYAVIDALSAHRMSAVLITDENGYPAGVISKTNLVVAWHHGQAPDTQAAAVVSCDRNDSISRAMTTMLLGDMGRIFVHDIDPQTIVGVMSLSDAANHRSGTCRACVSSRMLA